MEVGQRRRAVDLVRVAGLLTMLVGLVLLLVVLVTQGVVRATPWASVLGTGTTITGTVITLLTSWWPPPPVGPGQLTPDELIIEENKRLDRAATALALAVRLQWTQEAAVRSLQHPEPIRIRWSTTARPVAAGLATVLNEGVVAGRPVRLRHDVNHVVELFRQLRARQLVVLGDPGAGKTVLALLFTLGLLGSRLPGEPVPVLLTASSWDPRVDHLRTWLERRILEEYPALANYALYGPDAAKRMVTEGRVMVVLERVGKGVRLLWFFARGGVRGLARGGGS